ncbi:hypothetical protein [Streptomyces sp. T028]
MTPRLALDPALTVRHDGDGDGGIADDLGARAARHHERHKKVAN